LQSLPALVIAVFSLRQRPLSLKGSIACWFRKRPTQIYDVGAGFLRFQVLSARLQKLNQQHRDFWKPKPKP
jgi:hypothetical protein